MIPGEPDERGGGAARDAAEGSGQFSPHQELRAILDCFEACKTSASEDKLVTAPERRRDRRRPSSTREANPKLLDVQVVVAGSTPWPEGCAGLVIGAIPPFTRSGPDLVGDWQASIEETVAESSRLLQHGGRLAAFVEAPATSPETVPGTELLELFGHYGLRYWGEVLWLRPRALCPLPEAMHLWRSPYDLPMRLPPVRIILGARSATIDECALAAVAQRGLADFGGVEPSPWGRDINTAWWPAHDTHSDEVVTGEAAARVIAQQSFAGETVVCLSGEVDAAIAAIRSGRRCRLAVRNVYELEPATQRLCGELERHEVRLWQRGDSANS